MWSKRRAGGQGRFSLTIAVPEVGRVAVFRVLFVSSSAVVMENKGVFD